MRPVKRPVKKPVFQLFSFSFSSFSLFVSFFPPSLCFSSFSSSKEVEKGRGREERVETEEKEETKRRMGRRSLGRCCWWSGWWSSLVCSKRIVVVRCPEEGGK